MKQVCKQQRTRGTYLTIIIYGTIIFRPKHVDQAGDVAQLLESRSSNPKTLGSIPWRDRVRSSFFCPPESTLEHTCLCLTPLRVSDMCRLLTHGVNNLISDLSVVK